MTSSQPTAQHQYPPLLIAAPSLTADELSRLAALGPSVREMSGAARAALSEDARAAIKVVASKVFNRFGPEDMDLFPNLELIANFGVGFDNIDVAAATARGITVTNTPDVLDDDVADLTVAMMLGWSRRIVAGEAWVRSGRWAAGESFPLNRKMSGAKVGIAGLGRIGRAIADRLVGFGMEIHYTSRREKETPGWAYHSDQVALAEAVDWLVVAVVGGAETRGYISHDTLAALGPQGVLVNIARGSCVDEDALFDALASGAIAGAALDVYENEPMIDPRFFEYDNLLLQPHQASGTVQTRRAMSELQCANIAAHLRGEAVLTPVN